MEEKVEKNEAFVVLHEQMHKAGASLEEIVQAAIKKFKLGGKNPRHTYRAVKARLHNPNKYGGRYHERMHPFMTERNKTITVEVEAPKESSVVADAVVAVPSEVEVTVETASQP